MGVQWCGRGMKTVSTVLLVDGGLCLGVEKPLKTVLSRARHHNTPMNGGVNENAQEVIVESLVKSRVSGCHRYCLSLA